MLNFDFLIKGGLVLDGRGSGDEPEKGDIGIISDRIRAIGNLSSASADKIIHAEGLCVCPGFIDTHAHSEFTLLADGRAEGKVCQGITTEINGNCGLSAAPLYGAAFEHRENDCESLSIKERWNSFSEYFMILNNKRFALNFMTLVGHGNLRASVAGYASRELTHDEKGKMKELLKDALHSGARGLSTGLVYPPGVYADTGEIIDLAREAAKYEGTVYTTHMRSEGDGLREAIDEAVTIGFDSGIPVHISHLKTSGKANWGKWDEIIERLQNARQKGLRITCDRYPYIAASTDLDAVLPSWVYEGGHTEELRRLNSPQVREKIKNELLHEHPEKDYWEGIAISSVGSGKNKWMEGKRLSDIGAFLGKLPVDILFEILVEENLRTGAIFFSMNEDNLKSMLKLPFAMIGSDSSARSFNGITARGKPHPRGFGCFPRILGKYVRDERIMPLQEAVYKMTGLAADTFNIKKRGIIAEDFFADITVFDRDKVKDISTYDNPFQRPEGVYYVFVNGVPALLEGELTGALSGRVLR